MTGVLIRRGEEDPTHTGQCCVMTETEIGVPKPRNTKDCQSHQKLRERRPGKDSLFWKDQPCQHQDLGLWPPGCKRIHFYFFKLPVCGTSLWQPGKPTLGRSCLSDEQTGSGPRPTAPPVLRTHRPSLLHLPGRREEPRAGRIQVHSDPEPVRF